MDKKKPQGYMGLLILVITVFLIIGLILIKIVDVLFDITGPVYTQINNLCPDNILIYIGGLISSIASLFLGLIVYKQNKRANDINERLNKLEEEEYIPFIGITDFCGRRGEAKIKGNTDKYINNSVTNIIDPGQQKTFNVATTYLSEINFKKDYFVRLYDIHFIYTGKTRCKKIEFKKVLFTDINNKLIIDATPKTINYINLALTNNDESTIQFAMIYDELYDISNIYNGKIVIELILKTVNNSSNLIKIIINKHFIVGTKKINDIIFSDIEIATDIDYN